MNTTENFNISSQSFSLLAIGKTAESSEALDIKRYIGVGTTEVIAVNPTKAELDKIFGYDVKEPEYVTEDENGKVAHVTFVVRTVPEQCNGIETINRVVFTLRATPAYNRDKTKVQVLDNYGNSSWADVEDAKAGKQLLSANGNPMKIDTKYRMACQGEVDLVSFLKIYLNVQDVFNYIDGSWVKKENADDFLFSLEHVKDYFNGDFKEVKEAIALQPHNKVKLLYGVRTTDENKQYQAIATRDRLIMRNNAGSKTYEKVEAELNNIKQAGGYSNTEYKVQELAEYKVEATNLEAPSSSSDETMPWD